MLYGSLKDHTRIAEKEIQFESGEIMDAVRITQGLVMDCGIGFATYMYTIARSPVKPEPLLR